MPQMRFASAALYFGPAHSVATILFGFHEFFFCRGIEARPSASRIKLCLRAEQRLSATNAFVSSRRLRVLVFPCVRRLRSLLPGHVVLILRKLLFPLGFCFLDFFLRHHTPPIPPRSVLSSDSVRTIDVAPHIPQS